ncbi:MAG TPA: hypothetical protein VKU80_07605 [Planctomycetota bacterium]|nr:hypothetical protein [Planctomycetota bacterium]
MRAVLALLLLGVVDDPPGWTQAKPGEFPAAGSAREISGELIGVEHVGRTGVLRPDRNDSQRTDDYDIALPFSLLPYAKILYHGAYAELRDVPIGTHLHGLFFVQDAPAKNQKPVFNRALELADDFSRLSRLKRFWRVEAVEADKGRLTVTGLSAEGAADPKPTIFQIGPATRIWKARGFGKLADVAPGQQILANLTVCTLKGPGRCTDLWLDEESRALAREQQLEIHKHWQREHGLGCWIEAVDNQAGTVTVTIFDAADPSLLKEVRVKDQLAAAVAEESLRTYDQNNDVRRGPVLDVKSVPPVPGSSGMQVTFKPNPLLEGYRPKRFLRVFAAGWRIDDLPREERLYR